jgi:hypothetical protein
VAPKGAADPAPTTSDKAERLKKTILREWVLAVPCSSSYLYIADLPTWLAWYTEQRQ